MHAPYGLVEVVDVDFQNVVVELLGLSDQMSLDRLILPDLLVDIGLYVGRHVLLCSLRELLRDLALKAQGVALGADCQQERYDHGPVLVDGIHCFSHLAHGLVLLLGLLLCGRVRSHNL